VESTPPGSPEIGILRLLPHPPLFNMHPEARQKQRLITDKAW
jgi:hypothetical protein